MRTSRSSLPALVLGMSLAGCAGGPGMLSKKNLSAPVALAVGTAAQDDALQAGLATVILRNGPGSWAKDAYWDEYVLRLDIRAEALSVEAVQLTGALGEQHDAQRSRAMLRRQTKENLDRYQHAKLDLDLGAGPLYPVLFNPASLAVALPVTFAYAWTTPTVLAGGLAVGTIIAGPFLAASGTARMVKNTRLNNEIERRAATSPLALTKGAQELHLFFPITPAPQKMVVHYRAGGVPGRLEVPLQQPLAMVHMKRRTDAESRRQAESDEADTNGTGQQ